MMRIDDLRAFVTLADAGTYHAAARLLFITQPALTRRIQKLEELLGVTLVERNARGLRLTGAGHDFLDKARRIVVDTDNAVAGLRAAGTQRHGQIRIACLPSVGLHLLPEVLPAFQRRHPRVALRIEDANALHIFGLVRDGEADFGLGMEMNEAADLTFEPLYREPLCVVCSHQHPLAAQERLTWADLAGHPLVFNIDQSGNWLLVQRRLHGVADRLNWFHQTQSILGALMLARRGDAAAVMPASLEQALALKDIVFRPVSDPQIDRRIVVVQRTGSLRSAAAQNLLDLLKEAAASADIDHSGAVASQKG